MTSVAAPSVKRPLARMYIMGRLCDVFGCLDSSDDPYSGYWLDLDAIRDVETGIDWTREEVQGLADTSGQRAGCSTPSRLRRSATPRSWMKSAGRTGTRRTLPEVKRDEQMEQRHGLRCMDCTHPGRGVMHAAR